jgi:hypothetical protein
MYLIIIKSSFNYYTQSSSSHTTEPNCRSAFSLALYCNQQYRCCCCHYFYRLYYYYFFCALTLFPFLFYSGRVVVLAATTTRFSSFFPFLYLSFFFSVDTNVVSYQQTYCSTDWLLQEGTRWWTNISRHRTEKRETGRDKKATAAFSFRHKGMFVLMLSFFVIILL